VILLITTPAFLLPADNNTGVFVSTWAGVAPLVETNKDNTCVVEIAIFRTPCSGSGQPQTVKQLYHVELITQPQNENKFKLIQWQNKARGGAIILRPAIGIGFLLSYPVWALFCFEWQ
jgi:hypothetical protein